jgi:hypothetical protein
MAAIAGQKGLLQTSWFFVNDRYRSIFPEILCPFFLTPVRFCFFSLKAPFALIYPPDIIALAAIRLATKTLKIKIEPKHSDLKEEAKREKGFADRWIQVQFKQHIKTVVDAGDMLFASIASRKQQQQPVSTASSSSSSASSSSSSSTSSSLPSTSSLQTQSKVGMKVRVSLLLFSFRLLSFSYAVVSPFRLLATKRRRRSESIFATLKNASSRLIFRSS